MLCLFVVFSRELKVHVVSAGSSVADYAGMYYEEHVKPVTDPYVQWAKETASSVWDRVKNRMFIGTRIDWNATAQHEQNTLLRTFRIDL